MFQVSFRFVASQAAADHGFVYLFLLYLHYLVR